MKSEFTPELIEKAKQAKTAEELLDLAKENGIEMSEVAAKVHYERLHSPGEISDEELDNVSGGGCGCSFCPRCGYPMDPELGICRSCKK